MMQPTMARRQLLAGVAALGAAGLAGCDTADPPPDPGSGSISPTPTSAASQASQQNLPSFRAFEGAPADLPGSAEGVMGAFLSYPRPSDTAMIDAPGAGDSITALVELGATAPVPRDRNSFWQGLEQHLNVELELTAVPVGEYAAKLSTVIAGGDLPDIVDMKTIPGMGELVPRMFQDLTEYLAGDAVLDYPYLANIPTNAWLSATVNGRIYGIPHPAGVVGYMMFIRQDIVDDMGISVEVTSAADFKDLCVELTDARSNRWATANPREVLEFYANMAGAPNEWRRTDAGFVHAYETEEYRRAIEATKDLWDSELMHPDSFTASSSAQATWFRGGTVLLNQANYTSWNYSIGQMLEAEPTFRMGAIPPPKFDGGGMAAKYLRAGATGWAAITQSDSPDRIRELLGVANWLAAPFGTNEYLYNKFGREGDHYTWGDSGPLPTDLGETEVAVPLHYITTNPPVLFVPQQPEAARPQHEYQVQTVPDGEYSAATGLLSETALNTAATLRTLMRDTASEVIQGRKTLADWDAAVAEWRDGGGDATRGEYEAQYEAAQ